MKKIKPIVFFPPVILLLAAVIMSFINKDVFGKIVNDANTWILVNFGWLFSLSGIIFLIIVVGLYFSPFGKVKIGGSKARPMLGKFEWFSITLTTGIAIGILFWATAEGVPSPTSVSLKDPITVETIVIYDLDAIVSSASGSITFSTVVESVYTAVSDLLI